MVPYKWLSRNPEIWIINRKPIVILLLDPTQIRVNNANNTKILGCVWWNYHTKHLAILKNEIESPLLNLFGIIIHQNNFLKYLYHQCLWPIYSLNNLRYAIYKYNKSINFLISREIFGNIMYKAQLLTQQQASFRQLKVKRYSGSTLTYIMELYYENS